MIALQIGMTKTAASVSGQVVSGQVSGAILDAFNNRSKFSVYVEGMTVNFSALLRRSKSAPRAFSAFAYDGNVYKALPRIGLMRRPFRHQKLPKRR